MSQILVNEGGVRSGLPCEVSAPVGSVSSRGKCQLPWEVSAPTVVITMVITMVITIVITMLITMVITMAITTVGADISHGS